MLDLIVAARLGLGHEPSGIVLVRRVETVLDVYDAKAQRWRTETRYEVPAIERIPGGSSQAAVADAIQELVALGKENDADRLKVVVDLTTVGLPFRKLLKDRDIRAALVMMSDANKVRPDNRFWTVPQRELISIALGLFAERKIDVADLPEAAALDQQLTAFSTKPPPKDSLSDWRPAPQVDLAQALMIGLWWSERMLRSIVRQPPPPREAPKPPRGITFDEALKLSKTTRLARAG